MTAKVLIVDDHSAIRFALVTVFTKQDDFEVVGEAETIAETVEKIEAERPDVVVLDIRLPDGSGLDLLPGLRAKYPDMGIVIHTMYAGDDELFAAIDGGASGFVPKSAPLSEIVAAARSALDAPDTFRTRDLASALRRRAQPTDAPELTAREARILTLIADGVAIPAIARDLGLAESTTKANITKLYSKLGATNAPSAVLRAVKLGLLPTGRDES
ncbi:MAG: response regulator transcription factor [Actinomycetes bacterium]